MSYIVPSSVVRREVLRLVKEGHIKSIVATNLLGSVMRHEEFFNVPDKNSITERSDIVRRRLPHSWDSLHVDSSIDRHS